MNFSNQRAVIYQLLVRTFGNTNKTRKVGGTIEENGCGKFGDITPKALQRIRQMGFDTVWLTGILEQASGEAYPGRPADPADILKGKAGSPYAIRDYFDVCPDYANDPEGRIDEFRSLVERCHRSELRVIIDFVPNHVARSYESDVRPEHSFGEGDDPSQFFDRENHFFYLDGESAGDGPPLRLPTADLPGCDGLFEREAEIGRVTGNNSNTWAPLINDWYETVKLNYGHDYRKGRDTGHLPDAKAYVAEVPKTWRTMDEILAYWQEMGVDGFRVDMAHMVPIEFWRWALRRARKRDAKVYFIAEAYDSDPMKMTEKDVIEELWLAGFNGAYEHPIYKILQGIYEEGKWANDLDEGNFVGDRFHHCVRYIENHDEVRIAHPQHWGGFGMQVGRPAAGVMYGMSRASLMLYAGQEVGEPAAGAEGFSGDDGRSSIFDYTSLPELQKWVNNGKFDGGGLSSEQAELRNWYAGLLKVLKQPAFTDGEFYGLNHLNLENQDYGRVDDESVSGHWLYGFLRSDAASGQQVLCLANFHPDKVLTNLRVRIPVAAVNFSDQEVVKATGIFGTEAEIGQDLAGLEDEGFLIDQMAPFSVQYYELK